MRRFQKVSNEKLYRKLQTKSTRENNKEETVAVEYSTQNK